ncbi:hypothetical protein [Streptomyces sp. NPDC002067]
MPQRITGNSRLTIGTLLHDWQHGEYCLLAYASSGDKGVVATFPDHDGGAPDLWSIAARHEARTADHEAIGRWCLATGRALSSRPRDHCFTVSDTPWTLDVRNVLDSVKPHQYGNSAYGWRGAYVGVLTVEDEEIQQRAHDILNNARNAPRKFTP